MSDRGGFTHEPPGGGATVDWSTPRWVFDRLGLVFDLDPCAPLDPSLSHVPARNRFTRLDDGLGRPWPDGQLAFVNPPYGPETGRWAEKLARHGHGIALTFARTDVAWFHDWAVYADLICFVRGRIRFLRLGKDVDGGPGAGSMLLAYGPVAATAVQQADLGMCVTVRTGGGSIPADRLDGAGKELPSMPVEELSLPLWG